VSVVSRHVGEIIREIRGPKPLKQLAEEAKVSTGWLSAIENGKGSVNPSETKLRAVGEALGESAGDLVAAHRDWLASRALQTDVPFEWVAYFYGRFEFASFVNHNEKNVKEELQLILREQESAINSWPGFEEYRLPDGYPLYVSQLPWRQRDLTDPSSWAEMDTPWMWALVIEWYVLDPFYPYSVNPSSEIESLRDQALLQITHKMDKFVREEIVSNVINPDLKKSGLFSDFLSPGNEKLASIGSGPIGPWFPLIDESALPPLQLRGSAWLGWDQDAACGWKIFRHQGVPASWAALKREEKSFSGADLETYDLALGLGAASLRMELNKFLILIEARGRFLRKQNQMAEASAFEAYGQRVIEQLKAAAEKNFEDVEKRTYKTFRNKWSPLYKNASVIKEFTTEAYWRMARLSGS